MKVQINKLIAVTLISLLAASAVATAMDKPTPAPKDQRVVLTGKALGGSYQPEKQEFLEGVWIVDEKKATFCYFVQSANNPHCYAVTLPEPKP